MTQYCPHCTGKGYVVFHIGFAGSDICDACGGTGVIEDTEMSTTTIRDARQGIKTLLYPIERRIAEINRSEEIEEWEVLSRVSGYLQKALDILKEAS